METAKFTLVIILRHEILFIITLSQSFTIVPLPKVNIEKTPAKANEALTFCNNKDFNTHCILIDMSLHSGVKRFFIWDFQKDTIVERFLVGMVRKIQTSEKPVLMWIYK
ncbi:MAG TPA: hypothetical protein PK289_00525 [Bacteroidia bacterium]|jgi:hypothetical protein|nr:hypothetical protein [Bacteroidia bacterium]HRG54082.1 hypothetical protein [Bacteroidia bacterium]